MMRADLHVHSTASDGQFTPAQLKQMGRDMQLDVLALTDHDTLGGLVDWPADDLGPRLIPGVEISCAMDREIHLLAYGASPTHEGLAALLNALHKERSQRAHRMAEALKQQGLQVDLSLLPADGSVGRPHLARMLVTSGQVSSIQEAFDRYLSPGRPAYVPRIKRSPGEMIRQLRDWGLAPVLAHPGQYGYDPQALYSLVQAWKRQGLAGIEVYHSANRPWQPYDSLAASMDLISTGGSDFHGMDDRHSSLGSQADLWQTAALDIEKLLRLLGE